MEQLLLLSINAGHMNQFLTNTEQQLRARTLVNYTAALQWHFGYLRFLLHPQTTTLDGTSEQHIQQIIRPSLKSEQEAHSKELKDCMKKVRSVMARAGEVAEKQTILRNGKEALMEQGRWVEMDFMVKLKESVDAEGWARMESLEQRIALVGIQHFAKVIPSMAKNQDADGLCIAVGQGAAGAVHLVA